MNKKQIITAIVAAIFLVLAIILWPFVVVQAGNKGVVLNWGAVSDNVISEGIHFRIPIAQKVVLINTQTQTISFDADQALGAASKDLQDVRISLVVNFHPDVTKVNTIYQTFGTSYKSNILEPIIRETVKTISATYTAEELVTRRAEVSALIEESLNTKFIEKMMILESASIVNFAFSDEFNRAIEGKVTAEQTALASKNRLEQVKYEAEQQVVQAQADADSTRIRAEAEAEAIKITASALAQNQNLVELEAVKKWDGTLPTYMLGESVPFLNLP